MKISHTKFLNIFADFINQRNSKLGYIPVQVDEYIKVLEVEEMDQFQDFVQNNLDIKYNKLDSKVILANCWTLKDYIQNIEKQNQLYSLDLLTPYLIMQFSEPIEYTKLKLLGEGSAGKVYQIMNLQNDKIQALKKMKLFLSKWRELDEIKFPLTLNHTNIAKAHLVFKENDYKICMLMDYYEKDVSQLIDNKNFQLDKQDIHIIAYDLLQAIAYLHKNKIMHRDIKPSNILINSKGQCALSDFGLARDFPKENNVLTKHLVTKWYRAPEIFFGANKYDESIDIWSFGCVFGELLKKQPLFNGNSELDILMKIFNTRGSIDLKEYPEAKELPNFLEFQDIKQQPLDQYLSQCTSHERAIFDLSLQLNPKKRPKAEIMQNLDYFKKPSETSRQKLGDKIKNFTKQIYLN